MTTRVVWRTRELLNETWTAFAPLYGHAMCVTKLLQKMSNGNTSYAQLLRHYVKHDTLVNIKIYSRA